MSELNYDKFRDSLKRLEERYEDYKKSLNRPELLASDRESIKESCIQRFEVCFDTTWKHLKKYLEQDQGIADLANSPKVIFKQAFAAKVIEDAEVWIEFNNKRIDTSHDYSGNKADDVFMKIDDFIEEAIALYEIMTQEKWK